jgi:hypothetical protein
VNTRQHIKPVAEGATVYASQQQTLLMYAAARHVAVWDQQQRARCAVPRCRCMASVLHGMQE